MYSTNWQSGLKNRPSYMVLATKINELLFINQRNTFLYVLADEPCCAFDAIETLIPPDFLICKPVRTSITAYKTHEIKPKIAATQKAPLFTRAPYFPAVTASTMETINMAKSIIASRTANLNEIAGILIKFKILRTKMMIERTKPMMANARKASRLERYPVLPAAAADIQAASRTTIRAIRKKPDLGDRYSLFNSGISKYFSFRAIRFYF
ncbi:hypothetical protein BpHYR1_046981 [Brachionus plicatilis]|uniref:Uncharacterized protein n=1 Tax=Brachionus plicatilis TaxID=10195 RepID=A0A3M7SDP4_BRAPC|nr:hypothetical protein BpHYR1_046981 [Brachionus plicatilis]